MEQEPEVKPADVVYDGTGCIANFTCPAYVVSTADGTSVVCSQHVLCVSDGAGGVTTLACPAYVVVSAAEGGPSTVNC